jgi:O-antigen ligase
VIDDISTHYSVDQSFPAREGRRPSTAAVALTAAIAAGPAAFTAYLAFRSGGYFAGAPAIVAVILAVALVLRLMLAEKPFEGFGPAMVCATVGLGGFAVWTLASAFWSHAPAQALIAFDRALMYWLALVLFGSFGWRSERLLWALRVLAATMFAVAVLALITRILPEIHSIPVGLEKDRLSYPISYWNGLGVFLAVALVLCCGLATRDEEPLWSKALASAASPILAATLYFTFSRGAIGALLIGMAALVLLTFRRGTVTAAIAIVPPTAVAVLLCLGTHVLSTEHYEAARGVTEGHHLAWELVGLTVAGGMIRVLLAPVDGLLAKVEISASARRRAWIVFAGVAVIVAFCGVLAFSGKISNGFEKFTESGKITDTGELQHRLTNFNNNGRIAQWHLALDTFSQQPLHGSGAGTFARTWAKESNNRSRVIDSHSLYLGVMAELGLVGILLLLLGMLAILVATARRIFGPDRVLQATVFAALLTWAVHAGFDWDWQLTATGFFFFALGGMAIAAKPGEREDSSWSPAIGGRTARLALSVGCLALVVTPALVAISQGKLDSAVRKFEAGNCGGASQEALSAIHVLSVRPDPYQVIGFCDMIEGQDALAVSLLETAVKRDEGEWESWYGLAVTQAAAGRSPVAAARRAYELAPREPLAEEGNDLFTNGNPKIWKRRAATARLPI